MTFLCWNLNKRPIQHLVAQLVQAESVDVVILLECTISVGDILKSLNSTTGAIFHYAASPARMKTIQIFTRFPARFVQLVAEGLRYGFYRIAAPAQTEILLAVTLFISKLHWTVDSQAHECIEFARTTAAVEDRVGVDRTVLVGDLNMNPFESGMVGAAGLNATMARQHALKETRTVQGKKYRFFYNPMWSHFGDRNNTVPGTYHYDNHEHVTYYWNMFDQLLVRPSLIQALNDDKIQIVEAVGSLSLLAANGTPDSSIGSDHLPLLFSLRL